MNMNAEGGGSGVGYVDLQHEIKGGRATRASRSTIRVALTTHAVAVLYVDWRILEFGDAVEARC